MSLTETCLALAIASTAIAVSTPPLMRAREVYVLNAAARDVSTRLHAARIHAISRGRDCRIRVETGASYVIECDSGGWEIIDRVELKHGVTITANARPEFHRRGNVSPTATLSVWDRAGRVRRIIVNINGRVRIQ